MTAATPDPRPTVCLCDGRPGPHGYGDSGCLDAVPDPRFRDQLAEALWLAQPEYTVSPWDEISETTRERYRAKVDALLPLIAAEVEARVQAAANQRAVEELSDAAYAIKRESSRCYGPRGAIKANALADAADLVAARAAALAPQGVNGCPSQPHHGVDCPGDACRYVSAPHAEEGQR